ncbi:MAG: DUF4325 domain-containing protein [Gemmatimonadetes bacterium]|nr:DUF4325 domain-containing protein [Gemmatimonadota bacterium]
MAKTSRQAGEIRHFLLRNIPDHPRDIIRIAAEHFGVTRQTVSYHLRKLVAEKVVRARGRTSGRTFHLVGQRTSRNYELTGALEEHVVWRELVAPLLEGTPANALGICQYGLTEMLNNARDHSAGTTVQVSASRLPVGIELKVWDDGVGVFRKIEEALGLHSAREAVLELTKGKLTTDPARHSGEGIFFTSRMFDSFTLRSDGLALLHDVESGDWFIEGWSDVGGTQVTMSIDPETSRTEASVFDEFSSEAGDYAFDVTHVPVALAAIGEENLISRSQARRVLSRCNLFRKVIFDFNGVSRIGQAFADEVFRVFQEANPEINLMHMRANPEVEKMIARARSRTAAAHPEQLTLV